jgi:hypothetical protein
MNSPTASRSWPSQRIGSRSDSARLPAIRERVGAVLCACIGADTSFATGRGDYGRRRPTMYGRDPTPVRQPTPPFDSHGPRGERSKVECPARGARRRRSWLAGTLFTPRTTVPFASAPSTTCRYPVRTVSWLSGQSTGLLRGSTIRLGPAQVALCRALRNHERERGVELLELDLVDLRTHNVDERPDLVLRVRADVALRIPFNESEP